ncbi:MAG: hypothetical protein HZC25_16085 [Rhodospirillales bacterium]|nr:hypothetical protein [Rhodospirillales bacterium]
MTAVSSPPLWTKEGLASWRRPVQNFLSGLPGQPAPRFAESLARARTDAIFNRLSAGRPSCVSGPVLIDGMWDNPHFWLRYSLLRAALGLANGHEIGLLGAFRRKEVAGSFRRFGVRDIRKFHDCLRITDEVRDRAGKMVAGLKEGRDIFNLDFPFGFPAGYVFDAIHKRQRTPFVDIRHAKLTDHFVECLATLEAADRLLEDTNPSLLVMSHSVNFHFGGLVWCAMRRNIPVVIVHGDFGLCRFVKKVPGSPLDMLEDRPYAHDLADVPEAKRQVLRDFGKAYMEARLQGTATDIGAIYSYQKRPSQIDRRQIGDRFGWNPEAPLVAVYHSVWFDWPHMSGMKHFTEFHDWITCVAARARSTPEVNWLFKDHPLNSWYQGETLAQLGILEGASNLRIVPEDWNNTAILRSIDGVVTYFGTVGIEASAMGVPVLTADRGWYDEFGFCICPSSRHEFLDRLATEWWLEQDRRQIMEKAHLFAGLFFCCPDWQGNFLLPSDDHQFALYRTIPDLLYASAEPIEREIEEIRAWYASPSRYYHNFKMSRSDRFMLGN